MVCDLAYAQLAEAKKAKLDYLLTQIPKKDQQRINKYNHAKKNSAITFGKACTWPDAIKKIEHYKKFNSWHYINVARNVKTINASSCQKDCITQAISFHSTQLSIANSQLKKAQALMFLGHWLGDIHQPLHVSFASDLGGNRTTINAVGEKCKNIHWLWDDCLISRQTQTKQFSAQYQQLLPKLSTFTEKDSQKWRQSGIVDWANESLKIATAHTTKYCQLHQGSCVENSKTVNFSTQELDDMSQIINVRMQQASVRLAHLLASNL